MIAAITLAAVLTSASPPPLTAAEQRGRAIYLHGRSTSGRGIGAFFGADAASEIDASVVPCASCHGTDGRGVAEGTVLPSDIRWSVLSKYFVAPQGERRRPAYDTATLARAVREAIDAGAVSITAIMPRYRIDDADLDDLLAYMRRLGNEPRPGLDDATLTIATVVPLSSASGNAVRAVLAAYFEDVNAQGGLFGRRLRLETIDAAASPQSIAASLAGEIFAVAVTSWAEEGPAARVIRDERIPVVTPFPIGADHPSAFSLFADRESQAFALIEFAAGRAAGRAARIAVLPSPSDAVTRRCETLGWTVVDKIAPDVDFVLRMDGPSLVERKGNATFAAAPFLLDDLTGEGRRELVAFAERHRLAGTNRAAEIAAYAAAKVLVEALRRAGHDLTREKLIATLEQLYQLPTGVTRPITFAPGRHTAASGAYVVSVDPERRAFARASDWIAVE